MITIEETKRVSLQGIVDRSPLHTTPLATETLEQYIRWSEQVFTVKVDEEIVSVWGVMRPSLLSGEGYLWLLGTAAAEQHKFQLIRHSQRAIEDLLRTYTALAGDCEVNDLRAQRWMTLIGAKFGYPQGNLIPFRFERR